MITLLIAGLLSLPTFAQNQSSLALEEQDSEWSNTQLSLVTGLSARNIEDEFTKANLIRVYAGFGASTEFTPWLSGKLGIKFLTVGGSTLSVVDDFRPKSNFAFETTYLELKPVSWISLQGGFVEVQTSQNTEIMQTKDHAGGKLILGNGTQENLQIEATAFSTIPTSTQVVPRYFPADGNPVMSGATLKGGFLPKQGLQASLQISRINFQALPTSIAQDSRLAGNEVIGLGGKSARFLYDFDTDEIDGIAGFKGSHLTVLMEATFANNRKAPESLGQGLHAGTSLKYAFPKFSLKGTYAEFRIGSEVYPGSIAGDFFSFNNRQGKRLSLGVENARETLAAGISYIAFNEIVDQAFLADRQYIGFSFVAKKDLFSGSVR
jgi:hypothetical protein